MDPLLTIVLLLFGLSTTSALQCYSCVNMDWNHGDCVTKIVSCGQFQDACTSYVKWAVPTQWTPRGDRQYYISKDCDTRQGCDRRRTSLQSHCRRDWYNDWACVECCTGDLCNYYVTLSASSSRSSLVVSATAAALSLYIRHLVS